MNDKNISYTVTDLDGRVKGRITLTFDSNDECDTISIYTGEKLVYSSFLSDDRQETIYLDDLGDVGKNQPIEYLMGVMEDACKYTPISVGNLIICGVSFSFCDVTNQYRNFVIARINHPVEVSDKGIVGVGEWYI